MNAASDLCHRNFEKFLVVAAARTQSTLLQRRDCTKGIGWQLIDFLSESETRRWIPLSCVSGKYEVGASFRFLCLAQRLRKGETASLARQLINSHVLFDYSVQKLRCKDDKLWFNRVLQCVLDYMFSSLATSGQHEDPRKSLCLVKKSSWIYCSIKLQLFTLFLTLNIKVCFSKVSNSG